MKNSLELLFKISIQMDLNLECILITFYHGVSVASVLAAR